MFFNSSATYALRTLAYLAAVDGENAAIGRELAEQVRVPPPYLAKVMRALARAGVIRTSRGVRGGYRLARPAAEIRLVEIVEPFEGRRTQPPCLLDPERPCSDIDACTAHPAWTKARAAYVEFLETTTLADIKARDAGRPGGVRRRRKTARRRKPRS